MTSLDTSHNNASYFDAYQSLLKHQHWVIAFSGGLDSTVLLHSVYHFLQTLRESYCASALDSASTDNVTIPSLSAIHINHQLQVVSDDWEQHCQSVCDQLSVPLAIKKVSVKTEGKGLESAARQARYAVFEHHLSSISDLPTADTHSVLLMGHHANDQAETLLMRLFRGAGTSGAAAMPMQRLLGQSHIARPLLKYSRADLTAYAVEHQLAFIEDPSNSDESFDRNFVRQQLLPKLEKRWPSVVKLLNRYSEHASGDAELLADLARLDLQSVDASKVSNLDDTKASVYGSSLSITACLALSDKRRSNLLRYWLSAQQLSMPSTAQMAQIDNLLLSPSSSAKVQLGAYRLCPYDDRLYLLSEDTLLKAAQALEQNITWTFGESMAINGLGTLFVSESKTLSVSESKALGDQGEERAGLRKGTYTIGTRQEGLRFRYRGMSRSVKKCFNEHGVPPWLRNYYPVIYAGDEVAAIAGILVCDDYSQLGACTLDWHWA
jgi:tRNA(Ile)-lysidine synthase